MRRPLIASLLAAALAALACGGLASETAGTLQVDGATFTPVVCRSGQPMGFGGIELQDVDGNRVRFESQASGTAKIYWFEAGAAVGADLGECGTITLEETGLTVNDVRAVRGHADASCTGTPALSGAVDFDRCATELF